MAESGKLLNLTNVSGVFSPCCNGALADWSKLYLFLWSLDRKSPNVKIKEQNLMQLLIGFYLQIPTN